MRTSGSKEHGAIQVWNAAAKLQPTFAAIDKLVASNIRRVQAAFAAAQIGPHHFAGSTGYGHGDIGRAAIDEVFKWSPKRSALDASLRVHK